MNYLTGINQTNKFKMDFYQFEEIQNLNDFTLHKACIEGNCELVFKMIESGADIHLENIEGQTPLQLACFSGHTSLAINLIEHWEPILMQNLQMVQPLCFWHVLAKILTLL